MGNDVARSWLHELNQSLREVEMNPSGIECGLDKVARALSIADVVIADFPSLRDEAAEVAEAWIKIRDRLRALRH